MTTTLRPHDLIWLHAHDALEGISDVWVDTLWHTGLPVVVRRDVDAQGRIPVGVRGMKRDQRAAGWAKPDTVVRVCAPESLVAPQALLRSPFISQPPVQVALLLAQQAWPWTWGITGSAGYALATGVPVIHAASDLDLLIRAPQPLSRDALEKWQQQLTGGLCRADTQVETPHGAFALNEWLRDGKALLKTSRGPRLVSDPWGREA
ncbi:malonate decarboxylase holo-ACP synthase [Citrobacter rodentium]|uniref:Phosphoribosyl-dephospho-CoA transferase n=2 Tax=Citrobacter rodentium TaxID=67825 RepID=D2TME4_CITRI|nr:malonate decarboxylase holo-ACP synthase [Citrobacter rodentium]KIQ48960.1 phosphoribosyl-dephospho-CoA transferase [Citrobacter rodentium]QBY30730.1 malonate decarboxylase holo-ACP synthase [Citrobacter rodentium]UHO31901.1 malonate decarboxylase holo-ACP synthase [Citrobacter rodentium NBRC 105723 = DSM 16636]CBG91158.1 putative phosphoribosyl-dephospho-CoA transferase [Citrobacter rodentium ICC168]HAT8011217.1 phosphoribosyl-dephospho-CoA transferase [Citrobacter rodentium NBRC 105723 = 